MIRGINAAYIHAKKVNPDVQFKIVWAYTWFDPAKEADAAKALIEQGADVILQHTDSTAPQAAAAEAGNVYTFGQASDMAEYAPMPRISSIIDNWAPYYIDRVSGGDGRHLGEREHLGRHRPGHGRDRRDHRRGAGRREGRSRGAAAMRSRRATYHPFTGPLNKQDGSAWLAEGEVADDGTLAGMDFYVEGLEGDIPN